eukprot:751463-Hanusia_phi.AAC.1
MIRDPIGYRRNHPSRIVQAVGTRELPSESRAAPRRVTVPRCLLSLPEPCEQGHSGPSRPGPARRTHRATARRVRRITGP